MSSVNRITRKVYSEKEVLGQLNGLRGLFAILIVLGHCGRRFEIEPLVLKGPHLGAFVCVCFFFAVSGWSLAYNYDNRNNYLKGFINKKVLKLILLAIETEIVSQVLQLVFLKKNLYLNKDILLNINWYIYEILILYIVFWISYKFIKNTVAREVLIWSLSIVLCLIYWLLYKYGTWDGWSFAYYFSALSFPFGITVHRYYDEMMKKRLPLMAISLCLTVVSAYCIALPKDSLIGGVFLHNLLGICAVIILIGILSIVRYKNIKILQFITRNSTFIYLYQFCVLLIVKELYNQMGRAIDWLYVLIVLITTVLLGEIIYLSNMYLNKGKVRIHNKIKKED